jgi:hypothetical protein
MSFDTLYARFRNRHTTPVDTTFTRGRQRTGVGAARALRQIALDQTSRRLMPGEDVAHKSAKPTFAPNIFGRALDVLCSLYSTPSVRSGDERWSTALWERPTPLDAVMREADVEAQLGGTAAIVVRRAEDGGVDLTVFGADEYLAEYDWRDQHLVREVLIRWAETDEDQPQEVWLYADDTNFEWRFPGRDPVIGAHGLDRVPVVIAQNRPTSRGPLFSAPIGSWRLVESLLTIQQLLEETTWTGMLQRGQPVLFEDDEKLGRTLAPDAPWKMSGGSRAEILANNANINGMLSTVQLDIDAVTTAMGLPKQSFTIASIQPPYSAAVIQALDAEEAKARRRREPTARTWERDVHIVAGAYLGIDPTVTITYPAVPQVLTPTEADARARLKLEMGLADRYTIALELSPHLSPEEIRAQLEQARTERDEDAQRTALVAGRMDTDPAAQDSDDRPVADEDEENG